MKYNIFVTADLHWDAFDFNRQLNEMTNLLNVIRSIKDLNLLVIAGDYFDTKLSLNSKAARAAIQWIAHLVQLGEERNFQIRMIKGTSSHDNNQLDSLKGYENAPNSHLKIFDTLTVEETLPNLMCLYSPDENMNFNDYRDLYSDILSPKTPYDINFFHGTFDVIAPEACIQESEVEGMNSLIFQYHVYEMFCKLNVGGHWHDQGEIGDLNLYYTRSWSRWAFGEDNPKGAIMICYDTDEKSYYLQRIINVETDEYRTLTIFSKDIVMPEDITTVRDSIRELLQVKENHVRLQFVITDDKPINAQLIDLIRQEFINEGKRFKITIRDSLKKKKKEADVARTEEIKDKYSFVMDKSLTPAQKIQKYIFMTKDKSLPIDTIEAFVNKYIPS